MNLIGTRKKLSSTKKKDNNVEVLEKRVAARISAYTESQQEILKQMRQQSENSYDKKLQTSLQKALNTNDNGVPITDIMASKVVANLNSKDTITAKEYSELMNAVGETKQQLDLNVNGKVDIHEELKKVVSEEEW